MLFVISTYGMAFFQILFPLFLVYKLWRISYRSLKHWLIRLSFTFSVIILFYLIGRWDITGHGLRYWFNGTLVLVSLTSLSKAYHLPFTPKDRDLNIHWTTFADLFIAVALSIWALAGHFPGKAAIEISSPLKGSNYVVVQGGDTYPVNYHGMFAEAQSYALDIVQLNNWGFRASAIYPSKPEEYYIYADTVFSPVAGIVRSSRSKLPDQNPPETNGEKPYGNYLWIEHDSLNIVLAHLKKGSLLVNRGDTLNAGKPVALVGNTGNTSEPHLHIHAVTFNKESPWNNDSTFYGGNPVPLGIKGNFLGRNQILP